jgi:3-keto-5-aminohexanoate cleavage enzyme
MFSYQNLTRQTLNISKLPPLIVSVAITGGNQGKEANPNLPESAQEQAQSTFEAYQAGAAMVHVHRRRGDNPALMSSDPEEYREVNRLIREKCPDIIICNTGGGGIGMTIEQKVASAYAKPEVQSIDLASWGFRNTYKARKPPLFGRDEDVEIDEVFGISHGEAEHQMKVMIENDVVPEIELYDTANFAMLSNLMNKSLLKPPYWMSLVCGVGGGGSYATMFHLNTMLEYVPEGSVVSVIGIGASQWPLLAMAIGLGCHVRVGMEDNTYLEKGRLAVSNAELVNKVVSLAKILGRPIATPAQAREIIGLPQEPRQYKQH